MLYAPWLLVLFFAVGLGLGCLLTPLCEWWVQRSKGHTLRQLMAEHTAWERESAARWKTLRAACEADRKYHGELVELLAQLEHVLKADELHRSVPPRTPEHAPSAEPPAAAQPAGTKAVSTVERFSKQMQAFLGGVTSTSAHAAHEPLLNAEAGASAVDAHDPVLAHLELLMAHRRLRLDEVRQASRPQQASR